MPGWIKKHYWGATVLLVGAAVSTSLRYFRQLEQRHLASQGYEVVPASAHGFDDCDGLDDDDPFARDEGSSSMQFSIDHGAAVAGRWAL